MAFDFNLSDVGDLFRGIREALTGEKIQDPQKLLQDIAKLETTFVQFRGQIIEAEAKSEHWLTATWRPIVMLVFTFIIANNYIIAPYASALFNVKIPVLALTDQIWNLLTVGIGGYIAGRSAEKFAQNWRKS